MEKSKRGKAMKENQNSVKEKNKKPVSFVFALILGFVSLCLAALCCVFAIRAYREVSYIVRVEDSLYDSYFAKSPVIGDECKITFVKNSDENAETETFFGPIVKTAGFLRTHQEIALLDYEYPGSQKFYALDSEIYLPSVPADFSSPAETDSLNSPDLNLEFSTIENLPENKRALPVSDSYADSPDYKLRVKKGVLCTVNEKSLREMIFDHCGKIFQSEEKDSDSNLVSIVSVGDIMVARGVQEILIDEEDGLKSVFEDTLPLLQNADFTIGNLEGVVTDSWKNATKTYTFKFKKAVLPKLLDAGFDYLMQTNNHCYDYGESGFKDTLAAFEEYKIPSSGIGKNKDEAEKFYHTKIKGLPVAVISCGAFPVERSGFNGETSATATDKRAGILWKSDELLESVRKEKDAGNFVIVNVHGGAEYVFTPTKAQREFYEALCDNGADVVFGSHPHVLQTTEWHGKSLIVFSMGNFIFNGMEETNGGTDSEVVKLGVLDGRIAYVEQYPASIKNNGVKLKG